MTPTEFRRAVTVIRELVASSPEGLGQVEGNLLLALVADAERGLTLFPVVDIFHPPAQLGGDVYWMLTPEIPATQPEQEPVDA